MVFQALDGAFSVASAVITWWDQLVVKLVAFNAIDEAFRYFIIQSDKFSGVACFLEHTVALIKASQHFGGLAGLHRNRFDVSSIVIIHDKDVLVSCGRRYWVPSG